jgi:hypothetical protein
LQTSIRIILASCLQTSLISFGQPRRKTRVGVQKRSMLMIANKHTYNLVIALTNKLDFFPITPS